MINAPEPRFLTYQSAGKTVKRPILDEGEPGFRSTFESIPVISFKHINSSSLSERQELAKEVGKACRDIGFFYASDVDLPADLVPKTFGMIKAFFSAPEEDKMAAHWHKSPACRGFEPFEETSQGSSANLRESFSMGDDWMDEEQHYKGEIPEGTRHQNLWPPAFPALRSGLYEYYASVYPFARSLLKIFALALDLPEDGFEAQYGDFPITGMRVLHYPPQQPDEDNPGLGAHADFSSFTLVCQEPGSAPALEVLNLNGKWISAPPIEGATFTVNVGDFLEAATNGAFVSTVHRVHNKTGGSRRYSLPFFMSPDPNAVIEPLAPFVGEEGVKFPPMDVGQHYVRRVLNSRFHHPSAKFVKKHGIPMNKWTYSMMQGVGVSEEDGEVA